MRLHSLFALVLIAALTFGLSSCGDDELPVCKESLFTVLIMEHVCQIRLLTFIERTAN